MVDISFYHLQKTPLEKSLPRLVEKVYASQQRCVVLLKSEEQLEDIDNLLWTYSQQSFLAHGCKNLNYAKFQPIWLTTTLENPNHSSMLVVIEAEAALNFNDFNKCLDLFNGYDDKSVSLARLRWQHYKAKNHQLTYWSQNDQGIWSKKDEDKKP